MTRHQDARATQSEAKAAGERSRNAEDHWRARAGMPSVTTMAASAERSAEARRALLVQMRHEDAGSRAAAALGLAQPLRWPYHGGRIDEVVPLIQPEELASLAVLIIDSDAGVRAAANDAWVLWVAAEPARSSGRVHMPGGLRALEDALLKLMDSGAAELRLAALQALGGEWFSSWSPQARSPQYEATVSLQLTDTYPAIRAAAVRSLSCNRRRCAFRSKSLTCAYCFVLFPSIAARAWRASVSVRSSGSARR
jgi:hypothetical protein